MNIFKSKINESEVSLLKLTEEYNSLNQQYADIQESLVSMTEQTNTYKNEFERVDLENKELKELLAQSKVEVEEAQLETAEIAIDTTKIQELVAKKAIDMIAELGHAPVEVLEDSDSVDKPKVLSILEQMKSLKGTSLSQFYNANKKAIHAALKNA